MSSEISLHKQIVHKSTKETNAVLDTMNHSVVIMSKTDSVYNNGKYHPSITNVGYNV